jgi:hypothetical protein
MPGFNIPMPGAGGGAAPSAGTPSANVEAFRAHRWRVEFEAFDVTAYAISCQRPSPEIDVIVMHKGLTQIHAPGKVKWAPIAIKFYEVVGKDTTSSIYFFNKWSLTKYGPVVLKSNRNGRNFRDAPGVKIYLEDGDGKEKHTYTLYHAWPSKIEPSELTYQGSELSTIQVQFVYDSAWEAK